MPVMWIHNKKKNAGNKPPWEKVRKRTNCTAGSVIMADTQTKNGVFKNVSYSSRNKVYKVQITQLREH